MKQGTDSQGVRKAADLLARLVLSRDGLLRATCAIGHNGARQREHKRGIAAPIVESLSFLVHVVSRV